MDLMLTSDISLEATLLMSKKIIIVIKLMHDQYHSLTLYYPPSLSLSLCACVFEKLIIVLVPSALFSSDNEFEEAAFCTNTFNLI